MDKQIIIDGVDVSGCLFYQTNFEEDYDVKIKHYCSEWHNSCESSNNSNCYYKQLKRAENQIVDLNKMVEAKEQECEKLKEEIKTNGFGCFNIEMSEELDQLKAELKQYKDVIDKLAGKTIAITSYDIPIEFYDHKDLTIQQLKKENEELKEKLKYLQNK